MVILIDTNVLLDVLQDRKPFLQESGEVIRLCGGIGKGGVFRF